MELGALALLADMTLAAALRGTVGASARLATVTLDLRLTGAPRTGRLRARSSFDGFVEDVRGRQGLARVEIRAARRLVAHGAASFMVLGGPAATPAHPLPRRGEPRRAPALDPGQLGADEERAFRRACQALRAGGPFLAGFWGYCARRTKGGARATAPTGLHIGNRVGHAQGGVTFGLAAHTAQVSLGPQWRLASASAWYVGPGMGNELRARSTVLHRGLLTAVVHTRIEDDARRGVLECVSAHSRAGTDAA